VKPNTLAWWRRKLRREGDLIAVDTTALALVEVVAVADERAGAASDGGWELEGPDGHVLRVAGDLTSSFAEVLVAILGGR
jgi:hypothetical protein